MIQLTFVQSFIADFMNIFEILLVFRLIIKDFKVRPIVMDSLIAMVVNFTPVITRMASLDPCFLLLYIVIYERLKRHSVIEKSIIIMFLGVIMTSLFDATDYFTNLLFLKNTDKIIQLGWLIPINDLLVTVIVGITLIKVSNNLGLLRMNRESHYIWKLAFSLFVLYIVITSIAEYDQVGNRFGPLLLSVYFVIILVGGGSLFTITKDLVNNQRQQALIKSYQRQIEYSQRINKQFDNFRRERHDIKNLLLGVQGYIKDGENDKADKMLSSFLDTNISDKHYLDVDNALSKLQISGLRNLIKEKAYQIIEQGIPLAIEINNEISSLPGSEVKTARIIGILLDNAIEATKNQKKPYVQIALLQHDENLYELIVANSLGTPVDINKAMKFEHSTKQGHQGIGLSNVMKLVDHDQHYSFSAEVKDKVIIMTCFIQGKSE